MNPSQITSLVSDSATGLGWSSAPIGVYIGLLINSANEKAFITRINRYHNFLDENFDEKEVELFAQLIFLRLKRDHNIDNPGDLF